MRRLLLYGLISALWGTTSAAQAVPARDLWSFPLGAILEPAALATEAGSGLWNPASAALPAENRIRLGIAALSASSNQGAGGLLFNGVYRRANGVSIGVSFAQSSIDNIVRTNDDPTAIDQVQYSSTLMSASVARRVLPHLTVGAAGRWRQGRADQDHRSAVSADLGMIVDSIRWKDARLAASTFLWRPGRERDDQPVLLLAGDLRLLSDTTRPDIRVGMSRVAVYHGETETGPFASYRVGLYELRGAVLRSAAYQSSTFRVRSGIALHFARYVVGFGLEQGVAGLGPLYQFTLNSNVR